MALGTTYDEVRQARAATTADQQALADRLGLRLGDTHRTSWTTCCFPPDIADLETLERRFGKAVPGGDAVV
jgi:hypothetical protein